MLVIDDEALTDRELAWSQTEYAGDMRVPYTPRDFDEDGPAGWSMRLNLIDEPPKRDGRGARLRLSQLIVGMCALVAMTAIGGVAYTLAGIENRQKPRRRPPWCRCRCRRSARCCRAPRRRLPAPVPPPPSPNPLPQRRAATASGASAATAPPW